MSEIADFVREYTAESLPRINYAGSGDPFDILAPPEREPLEDDPNLPLRTELIRYLASRDPASNTRYHEASDELIRDLFIAHWYFIVSHDQEGNLHLATEVLQRGLYSTFVQAFALPLGLAQRTPLDGAIGNMVTFGAGSPLPALLLALEDRLGQETNVGIRGRLVGWRLHLKNRFGG
jgi:hypothetical protein